MHIILRNGLKFHLRNAPGDLTVFLGIYGNHVYDGFKSITKSAPVIVDIGGHVGMFSLYAAQFFPHGRIYVYEPDPQNYNFLQENVSLNKMQNIISYNVAVSGQSGEATLHVNPGNSSENNMFKVKRGMHSLSVPAVTLEHVFTSNNISSIDFLKIDCEGSEYDILLRTPHDFLTRVERMAIEWHGYAGYKPRDLTRFLEAVGFTTTFLMRPRMIYARRS